MLPGDRLRGGQVAAQDRLRQLPAQTRREAYETLGVLCQELLVDSRFVVMALEVRGADEPDEVAVAGVAGGEEHQMAGVAVGASFAVLARTRRHVHLAADDRLDPGRLRRGVEVHRAIEGAVVGDRDRRLVHGPCRLDQLTDARRAVQQRELGVGVQMHERAGRRVCFAHPNADPSLIRTCVR